MSTSFYALRIESHRLIAAQVSDRQAAEFLDAGRLVVLASSSDLARLAQQRNKALVVFALQSLARAGRLPAGAWRIADSAGAARLA